MIYLYLFILVFILDYLQYKITAPSYSVGWSGYGGMAGVLRGKNFAPMQYRPLVSLIVGLEHQIWKLLGWKGQWEPIEIYLYQPQDKRKRPWRGFIGGLVSPKEMPRLIKEEGATIFYNYEKWKIVFMYLAFLAFYQFLTFFFTPVFCLLGIHLLAVAILATFMYDSIECYVELLTFTLATVALYLQQPWFFVALVFLAALNRETAVFLPILALVLGLWQFAIVGAVVYIGVYWMLRSVYGKHQHYCELVGSKWMWKTNLRGFINILKGKIVDLGLPTCLRVPFYQQDTLVAVGALVLSGIVLILGYSMGVTFLQKLV